jgi:hypothetical protein
VSKGEPRLLLMDGHGSHLTYDFLKFCEKLHIIPFCFVPHTTHIAQPLDGHPFQVYKHYFRSQNNHVTQWGGSVHDKSDFLRGIPAVRSDTFKQRTIRSSFVDRGIYPWDPSKIIQPLLDAKEPTPELQIFEGTPPPPSSATNSGPDTIRTFRRSVDKLQHQAQEIELPESFAKRLNRVLKKSVISKEVEAQQTADIENHINPNRSQNKNKTKRRIGESGPLYVKQANRKIEDRTEEERQRVIRRAKKAWKNQPICTTPERPEGERAISQESQLPTEQPQLFFFD